MSKKDRIDALMFGAVYGMTWERLRRYLTLEDRVLRAKKVEGTHEVISYGDGTAKALPGPAGCSGGPEERTGGSMLERPRRRRAREIPRTEKDH